MDYGMKLARTHNRRDGYYEISPLAAQAIYERRSKNRPVTPAKVARIREAIKANHWIINGESIIFGEDLRLIDGQHRIRAIAEAQRCVTAYCVFDPPGKNQAFDTIDTGTARGGSDIMALLGADNAKILAPIVSAVLTYETIGKKKVELREQRLRYQRDQATFDEVAEFIRSIQPGLRALTMPPSSVGVVVYIATLGGHKKAVVEFFSRVADGIGLKKGDPAWLLRQTLLSLTRANTLTRAAYFAYAVKAWKAYRDDRSISILKLDDREKAPTIE